MKRFNQFKYKVSIVTLVACVTALTGCSNFLTSSLRHPKILIK